MESRAAAFGRNKISAIPNHDIFWYSRENKKSKEFKKKEGE